MNICRVKGTVVSTTKSEKINGLKLLLVKAREYPELVTLMTPSENSQPAVVEEAPAEEAPTEVPPVVEAPAA